LGVGATGLGILRGAPGTGAVLMAMVLAHRPFKRHAGAIMLWCVAGFGACTVVFGLSRNVGLSVAALVMLGACDMVSVVVRHTLVQISTPDEMRGRVSAVNMMFIGASNEVGQFESGVTAAWLGAVYAMMTGFVAPNSFTFGDSLILVSIVLLGGIGNPWGLTVATAIVVMLPEKLQFIQEYRLLLYAGLVILILLFRPGGLMPRQVRDYLPGWK